MGHVVDPVKSQGVPPRVLSGKRIYLKTHTHPLVLGNFSRRDREDEEVEKGRTGLKSNKLNLTTVRK